MKGRKEGRTERKMEGNEVKEKEKRKSRNERGEGG